MAIIVQGTQEYYVACQLNSKVFAVHRQQTHRLLTKADRACSRKPATAAQLSMLYNQGHISCNTGQATLITKGTAAQLARMLGLPKVAACAVLDFCSPST